MDDEEAHRLPDPDPLLYPENVPWAWEREGLEDIEGVCEAAPELLLLTEDDADTEAEEDGPSAQKKETDDANRAHPPLTAGLGTSETQATHAAVSDQTSDVLECHTTRR